MSGIAAFALTAEVLSGAVVLEPVANMYSRSTTDSDVVSQATYGANVVLLERKEGWAHIRTADDYTGWTPLSALREGKQYASAGRIASVESMLAHLYRETSVSKHAPLLTVPFETRLEVIGESADTTGWWQVRLADDRVAWVQSGDVTFDAKLLDVAEMLALSKRYIGLPYTWGGTSSFGYDCSGFVQMLCRRRGVNVPRDAHQQAAWDGLATIDPKNPAPGDLLYFGSSQHKITHTGVYLGDSRFINATTYQTPTIRIDDLRDPHWAELLVAVRRVI